MSNDRFLDCKAVSFGDKQVPLWLCEYSHDDCGSEWSYEGEKSRTLLDATWDCKKKALISFFVVESKDVKGNIVVGTKVVVERDSKCYLEEVCDIEFNEFDIYYAKYKEEKDSVRLKGLKVPEGVKIVAYKVYRPTYIFKSGRSSVRDFYVKILADD